MDFIRKKLNIGFVLAAGIFYFASTFAFSEERNTSAPKISVESLKAVAIQESGRIKPLDTYARNVLLQLSGRRSFDRRPAIDWLAKLLFTPNETRDDKVFLINNSDIPYALGIEPDHKRRYSFSQLEKNFQKLEGFARSAAQIDPKKRSVVENEFLRVFEVSQLYLKLAVSLQFTAPHDDFKIKSDQVRNFLQFPPGKSEFNFIDIAQKAEQLKSITNTLNNKDAATWSPFEKEIFALVSNLYQWGTAFEDTAFTIIPSFMDFMEAGDAWVSPWDAVAMGFLNESVRNELLALNDIATAYRAHERVAFDISVHRFIDAVEKNAKNARSLHYIPLELLYNKFSFYFFAQFLYILALGFAIAGLLSPQKMWYSLSFLSIAAGFVPHTFALALRIVITARPPVTNLYETFIFVSWVTVLLGILIEVVQKKWLGIAVSGICGVILLIFASKFSTDGDTMKMLVAVLDSNFWLSIHVPNIAMGYAACCVAGILGHIYIIQSLIRPKDKAQLEATSKVLILSLGLGLMLAFFGTMLGGIWADQSWGRFWGWDPKENGALMIVLWCAMILHARIGKMIGPIGTAVLSVLLLLIVIWAWLGVNLLSVGLHSYGFASGTAVGFGVYIAAEILFLFLAVPAATGRIGVRTKS